MKSKKIFLTLIAVATIATTSVAQKEWSLEDCINYAIENNITVKRQELAAQIAEKNHFQSYMELLPNLNASGNHYYNSGKTLNQESYTYVDESAYAGGVQVDSRINIFNGLRNFNNIKKTKFDLMSQLENVEKAKNDITLNVSTAYLQILLNKELRDNAQKQLEVTLDQIEKTKKLVEIGNAAKGDLLQIEAQAAMEKASLTNTENNLKISYLDLTQLLNIEDPESFSIIFPEIKDITVQGEVTGVNEVYNEALEFLPEIKSAEYSVKSNVKNLAMARGSISPVLTLGYQYSSRYSELYRRQIGSNPSEYLMGRTESNENVYGFYEERVYANSYPYIDQINDNASNGIYLALNIPIFNRWQTKTSIDRAKINLSDSRLSLDLQKQNLYKGIQQARTQAIAAMDRYRANLQAVESMEEAFRYTEQKYEVGLVDILEYKTAKNNLSKTKSDLSQAKYEFIFRTKILDFYKGEQITL